MSAAKRKREVQVNFRVSPEELALIEQKMSQLGTVNREAYLRKMALDGYVVKLDLPELKELVSLMRYFSNNLNQLTRKVHETGRVYDADLEDISQRQEQRSSPRLPPLFLFALRKSNKRACFCVKAGSCMVSWVVSWVEIPLMM